MLRLKDRDYMFSPEQLDQIKENSYIDRHFNYQEWEKIDIYNLALWTLYYINRKYLSESLDFDQYFIDHKSIYNNIKNIALMEDKMFGDILRACLIINPKDRLSSDELIKLLQKNYIIMDGVNDNREAKMISAERILMSTGEKNKDSEQCLKTYTKLDLSCLTLNNNLPDSSYRNSQRSDNQRRLQYQSNKYVSYGKYSTTN